jgi:hypothetical protein
VARMQSQFEVLEQQLSAAFQRDIRNDDHASGSRYERRWIADEARVCLQFEIRPQRTGRCVDAVARTAARVDCRFSQR